MMPTQHPDFDEWIELPCGCKFGKAIEGGEPTMVFAPHHPDCHFFLLTMDAFAEQGKPIEMREVDDE